MIKRIVVLGTTGVNKRQAIDQLVEYRRSNFDEDYTARIVEFEKDYITPNTGSGQLQEYLDARVGDQLRNWRSCMDRCMKDIAEPTTDCFLLLHGSIIRDEYGTRCPICLPSLSEWEPDLVITLIDDVQVCWHRTQLRAGGDRIRGMPTLEQLIANRRAEMFLGDILASFVSDVLRAKENHKAVHHYVVAVRHPCSVLDRIVHPPRHLRSVYLSFPISSPRRMLEQGDRTGVEDVNRFLKKAYAFAATHPQLVLFCPLTIDELPLRSLEPGGKGNGVVFRAADRWNVLDFADEPLLTPEPYPESIVLRNHDVGAAAAGMEYDVRTRDYRLIDQSTAIAAFNPAYHENLNAAPDRETVLSRGMRNEIEYGAVRAFVPVCVYQDPLRDPEGVARWRWAPDPGALGPNPTSGRIKFFDDLDALFGALL